MTTPNPGSPGAVKQGCTCPVIENNCGRGAYSDDSIVGQRRIYWTTADCPLHGREAKEQDHD